MSGPPRPAARLLRRLLPRGSAGATIIGDLHEEYLQRPPGLRRDIWYAAVALRTVVEYRRPGRRRGAAPRGGRPTGAHGTGPWLGGREGGCRQATGAGPGHRQSKEPDGGDRRTTLLAAGRGRLALDGPALDLRSALRGLRRQPGQTALAVVTLALGIGASAAIFAVVHGALLAPLPYRDPGRLLRVADRRLEAPATSLSSMSPANFADLRHVARGFEGLVAYEHRNFNLSAGDPGGPAPVRVAGVRAEPGFFELLGTAPRLGRGFRPDDAGGARVVVLGHRLWRTAFGGDPSVVGRTVRLDLVLHTVVGVLPAGLVFPADPQVWVPLDLAEYAAEPRNRRRIDGLGRLAPGVTPEEGRAVLQAAFAGLAAAYPEANAGWTTSAVPVHDWMVQGRRRQLWTFAGAVAVVLLIACANVANLALARVESRRPELAVRVALGAGRARLARLVMAESALVALAGGALGTLASAGLVRLLLAVHADSIPRAALVGVGLPVLAFALALSGLTALLVGLAPALLIRPDRLYGELRRGDRGAAPGRRARQGLVVAEVALATVLVAGTGLMVRTAWTLGAVDLGVADADEVLTFALGIPESRYPDPATTSALWRRLVDGLDGLAGVEAVGLSSRTPLRGGTNGTMSVPGQDPDAAPLVEMRAVTPGIFDALGVPLLAGRSLQESDRGTGRIVVSETLARFTFPGWDPAGRPLQGGGGTDFKAGEIADSRGERYEIVGVVGDLREFGPEAAPRPTAYWLLADGPFASLRYLTVVVRGSVPPRDLLPAVRRVVRRVDPDVPLQAVTTLDRLAEEAVGRDRRAALSLLGAFAGLTLILGAVGTYGVMSASVTSRRRELGVRVALGATGPRVVGLVLGRGLATTGLGVVAGLVASLGSGRLLSHLVHGVEPWDPLVLVGVGVVLMGSALVACLVPARRALAFEIVEVLRRE